MTDALAQQVKAHAVANRMIAKMKVERDEARELVRQLVMDFCDVTDDDGGCAPDCMCSASRAKQALDRWGI